MPPALGDISWVEATMVTPALGDTPRGWSHQGATGVGDTPRVTPLGLEPPVLGDSDPLGLKSSRCHQRWGHPLGDTFALKPPQCHHHQVPPNPRPKPRDVAPGAASAGNRKSGMAPGPRPPHGQPRSPNPLRCLQPHPSSLWSRFVTIIQNFFSGSAPGADRTLPVHKNPGWPHRNSPHDQPRSSTLLRCHQTHPSSIWSHFFTIIPIFFSCISVWSHRERPNP